MEILFDTNNILSIEPDMAGTKEYTQTVDWYTFSDKDKWLIVVHKKEIKIIHLKELWNNMSVLYINKNNTNELYDKKACEAAATLFQWFDETTWKMYYFLPKYTEEKREHLLNYAKKLWLRYTIEKTNIGTKIETTATVDDGKKNIYSFLFWLFLIYGKFDGKWWIISSAKIQIPLFGQYLKHEEMINTYIDQLKKDGIFVKKSIQKTADWIVYQITCWDYELLRLFIDWYKGIEKYEKIHKEEELKNIKEQLKNFIQGNNQIPEEGKKEVLNQLQKYTIKLLAK